MNFSSANLSLPQLSEAAQEPVMQTEDFLEGRKAFIKKRESNWHAH
jgi:1,4-dihydroxy-2-naphthoyl-CoA synthase